MAFNLELNKSDYSQPGSDFERFEGAITDAPRLGESVSLFYGRTEEFALLEQWILNDRCRLVVLLGMGNWKPLAAKLAEQVKEKFEYVIWRSLQCPAIGRYPNVLDSIPIELAGSLKRISESVGDSIATIEYFATHRCLIVLITLRQFCKVALTLGAISRGMRIMAC